MFNFKVFLGIFFSLIFLQGIYATEVTTDISLDSSESIVVECFSLSDEVWNFVDEGELTNQAESFLCPDDANYVNYYGINMDRRFKTFGISNSNDAFQITNDTFPKTYNPTGDILGGNTCSISFESDRIISSNLNKTGAYDVTLEHSPDFLNQGYYMKTFVAMEVTDANGEYITTLDRPDQVHGIYSYPGIENVLKSSGINQSYLSSLNEVPYVLAKPEDVQVSFNESLRAFCKEEGISCSNSNYNFTIKAVPIDGKCDFNQDGSLNYMLDSQSNEVQLAEPIPFELPTVDSTQTCADLGGIASVCLDLEYDLTREKTVDQIDSDNDGVLDKYELTHCVGEGGGNENGKVFFGGCAEPPEVVPYQFKEVSCSGGANLQGTRGNQKIYCQWRSPTDDNLEYMEKCNVVKYNSNNPGSSTSGNDLFNGGHSMTYFLNVNSDNSGYYSCVEDDYASKTGCNGDIVDSEEDYEGKCHIEKEFVVKLPKYQIYDKFRELKVDTNKKEVELQDATKTTNKLVYNYGESTRGYYFVDSQGNREKLEDFTPFRTAMEVFNDGEYTEKELLNQDIFTLDAFKIRPFSSKEDMRDFLDTSSDIMRTTNITKSKEVNTLTNTKNINISMKSFPTDKPTTVYMIFDKSLTIDQIIPKESSGEFFIQEKDPIIGWYFNESEGEEEVNYEVPDNGDEGTIIVTQEPILFNEGELIINYRNTQCNPDETQLFQLDELEGSAVYNSGNKNFKICLGHVDENVGDVNEYDNVVNLGNITANNNITKTGTQLGASINKAEGENFVWDTKIQRENPDGNYSCVGSYGNGDPSTFGDCGFNPDKRLWIHFGQDTVAPETSIDLPFLAHTIYIDVKVEEQPVFGSGLKEVSYCTSMASETCNPEEGTTKTLSGDIEEFRIQETCPNDWGCRKKLRISATDQFDNKEETKEFELNIIEKGSSCQASCLSVPSPDRYLKECNNLNSCQYYETNGDEGETVAGLCDLQLEDAWVKYNDTHDIQCPKGPMRPTQFTTNELEIFSSQCTQLRTTPYPIVYNGESMIMNIVSCIE